MAIPEMCDRSIPLFTAEVCCRGKRFGRMSILELNLCLHKLKIEDKCQLKNGHTPISLTTAELGVR